MTDESGGSIEIFNSASDPDACAKFNAWRRAHSRNYGHYLNLNPTDGWYLHLARWPSVPHEGDCAANEKRCAARRKDLEQHAADNRIHYKRCQQCNPK